MQLRLMGNALFLHTLSFKWILLPPIFLRLLVFESLTLLHLECERMINFVLWKAVIMIY